MVSNNLLVLADFVKQTKEALNSLRNWLFSYINRSTVMPIPFEKKLFLKIWVIVLAATALVFVGAVLFFDYELTTADPICSPIAAALLAYFLHLMFYNPETAEKKD